MALSECSKHIKAACTEEFLSEALFLVEEELLELSNYHTSFDSYYKARKYKLFANDRIVLFQGRHFVLSYPRFKKFAKLLSLFDSYSDNRINSFETFISIYTNFNSFHSDFDIIHPSIMPDLNDSEFPF